MRPTRFQYARLLLPATAALLLSACRAKAPDSPAAAPVVNYWNLIAPLVAGSYHGKCLRPPDPAPFPGPIGVSADGEVSAGSIKANLRSADIALASDSEGGEATATLNAVRDDFTMMLADRGSKRALTAMVASGDQAIACDEAKVAPVLRALRVHALLAKAIDTPRHQISCIPTGALASSNLDFTLANGTVALGAEQFDLAASAHESALFTDGLSKLFYTAKWPDGRTIKLNLDEHGQLAGLEGKGRNDQLYVCK